MGCLAARATKRPALRGASSQSHCFVRFHVRPRVSTELLDHQSSLVDLGSAPCANVVLHNADVRRSSVATLCFVDTASSETTVHLPPLVVTRQWVLLTCLLSFSQLKHLEQCRRRQSSPMSAPVSFRDVARLLQPFLSGIDGARFSLIATVSPHSSAVEASKSSLRVAHQAALV